MRLGMVALVVALALAVLPTPAPAPIGALSVSPSSLSFTSTVGSNPPPQSMTISNGGGHGMTWTVRGLGGKVAWLFVAPSSGTDNATLVVTVDTTGLASGVYTATLYTEAPGATGSWQKTPVTLNLLPVTSPGHKSRRED